MTHPLVKEESGKGIHAQPCTTPMATMYAQYLTSENSCTSQYSIRYRRKIVCFTHHQYKQIGTHHLVALTLSMATKFSSLEDVGQYLTFVVSVSITIARPMQYTVIFFGFKIDNFRTKNCDIFFYFLLRRSSRVPTIPEQK